MQPYQGRVITEKQALDEKLAKLEAFTTSETWVGLEAREQHLLSRQLKAMREYSDVLAERIAAF